MVRNWMLTALVVAVVLTGCGTGLGPGRIRCHHVASCCLSAIQGADNHTTGAHHHDE